MAITYPLSIPGTIGAAKANLKKFDAVGEVISPFDGSAQQQQFADQHWELDLEWPEMTWAQFAALDAFSGALHGKLGSFFWGPPLASGPLGLGTLGGTPTCVGTDLSGSNTLTTQGWLPNQNGLLLPGDFLMLGTPYAAGTAEVANTFAVEVPVIADGLVTLTGQDVSLSSGGVPVPGTMSPAWIYVGASIFVAGTGVTDGGPFILLTVTNGENRFGQWVTTMTFMNSAALTSGGSAGLVLPASSGGGTTGASGGPRLYQYINPAPLASDGGGNASLDIFPSIREAPYAGMPVTLINPQGTFRLAANRRESPAVKTKTFTFAMKCREAI